MGLRKTNNDARGLVVRNWRKAAGSWRGKVRSRGEFFLFTVAMLCMCEC